MEKRLEKAQQQAGRLAMIREQKEQKEIQMKKQIEEEKFRQEEEREQEEEAQRAREAKAKEEEERYQKWAKSLKTSEIKPTFQSNEEKTMFMNQDLLKEFSQV